MKFQLVTTGVDPTLVRFTRRMMFRNAGRFGTALPFRIEPEGGSTNVPKRAPDDLSDLAEDHGLLSRIVEEVRAGKTDEQIISECDLESPSAIKMLAFVRDRIPSVAALSG